MRIRSDHDPGQLRFLEELVDSHANVAGDILQIGPAAWGIHGSIPVDGDVLVARFDTREEAATELSRLPPNHASAEGEVRLPAAHYRRSNPWP